MHVLLQEHYNGDKYCFCCRIHYSNSRVLILVFESRANDTEKVGICSSCAQKHDSDSISKQQRVQLTADSRRKLNNFKKL